MADISSALRSTIPISLFNRGMAGKVFEDVRRQGAKVVMKNNSPECVLLSPEEYLRLIDEVNDAKLAALAAQRMQGFDPADAIPAEEVYRQNGITKAALGSKSGTDLSGLLKIKLRDAGLRIVYKLVRTETSMLVIVIGARADDAVYKIAEKRAHKHEL